MNPQADPQTVHFPRSGQGPLTVKGWPVAEVLDGRDKPASVKRRHDVRLWKLADGKGYAAAVQFHTSWHGEAGHAEAFAGNAAEVAAWLAALDPASWVSGFPPGEQFRARQEDLLRKLRLRLAEQVGLVLAADPAAFAEQRN